jgi:hypothetical protein
MAFSGTAAARTSVVIVRIVKGDALGFLLWRQIA